MSPVKEFTVERPSERVTEPRGLGGGGVNVSRDGSVSGAESSEKPALEPPRIGYIGKRLGRFHIKSELGRGGMATVYRAHDPQLGRDVAVKVMHGFFAGRADIEARFLREANAVAAIRHPSILALYDFAPPAGEQPGYIVSELIEGPCLRQLVESRGGRLLPEIAANITVRVAEALGAAHTAGIVHRDVKPDNVLIDTSAGRARVVLTDFGVAHVSGMDTMTATGAVLGSPAYMSPEQARGDDVRPASDVFSLGVMLYQLCTGHLPFTGKDPLGVISAILRGEYLRPAKLEARVGPQLEQVIARCLQRDPSMRFTDGTTMAAGLRQAVSLPGFADDDATLRRFLGDPVACEREIAPAVAREALSAASEARRRRQVPRTLAELGRALAYAPDDPAARQMLARVGSAGRSRALAVAGAAAAAVAVAVVVATMAVTGTASLSPARPLGETHRDVELPGVRQHTTGGQPASGTEPFDQEGTRLPSASAKPAPSPSVMIPTAPSPAAAHDVRGDSRRAGAQRTQRKPRRSTAELMTSAKATSPWATTPASSGAGDLLPVSLGATAEGGARGMLHADGTERTKSERPVQGPDVSVPAPVPAPPRGSLIVRASHGFCEPSLDDHQPSLRANYNDLAPGAHEIFCTLPQGAGKVHVATYQLRAGSRPSLIVVRGPDGRPILGQPE